MAERDVLVEALVAEVLGPRETATETMPAELDPVDEFIVGVLAPFRASSVEGDADQELAGDNAPGADDDADAGDAVSSPLGVVDSRFPSLTIDPRARPASMGISLAVSALSRPVLDICCTWARYSQGGGDWHRAPHGSVRRGVDCSAERSLTDPSDPAVRLIIRSRRDIAGTWKVSLFLVNHTAASERPSTPEHVFQPQIRVRCAEGSLLVPLERQRPARDPEDEGLAFLYAGRSALARGHLCSALWRAVDPERPHPHGLAGSRPPFAWLDGRHLFSPDIVAEFEPSDARSEFVPVIPVNAPDKAWSADAGNPPELDPSRLAEIVDGDVLHAQLSPLAAAYEQWIDSQELVAGNPQPDTPAGRNLAGCRRALARLRDGIKLLATDDDARLAFAFANRAIAVQSQWTKGRVNQWWPFQIAYQLINIPAIVDRAHADREVCDLLWFPTGGGKTEAYLGLAAFTIAHRRIRARHGNSRDQGAGVGVLSRYSLRLLTIQQYRRALALMTACEYLRVHGPAGNRGWRPGGWHDPSDLLWGSHRFSIGLWVGGGVTPNNLQDFQYRDATGQIVTVHGAISILGGKTGEGDPAQVLNCPACASVLAVPPDGLREGDTVTLHLVIGDPDPDLDSSVASRLSWEPFEVDSVDVSPHLDATYATVSVRFRAAADASPQLLDKWFDQHLRRQLGRGCRLVSARASRPGYFVRTSEWGNRRSEKDVEIEIYCPDPECHLNSKMAWSETTEVGDWPVREEFGRKDGLSARCPIPAWTVDEQVYGRCPSMVVATVDKFARLAFEPRASALFGNVDRINEHLGYYRAWAPPTGPGTLPGSPRQDPTAGRNVATSGFRPPDLILQDELHLIEGPLGSMVGIYETAIDLLATGYDGGVPVRPKYIASTATVRQAREQVSSLFARSLDVFPPPGLRAEESFFSSTGSSHPLDSSEPGRLYVGVTAPGRGAQTPIVRIWSRLLQVPADRRAAGIPVNDLDPFWTLVGYFNAIRELAGAVALTRQDIIQRLMSVAAMPRELAANDPMELSSRASSLELPSMLEDLETRLTAGRDPVNTVVATSMFGTGVDVARLSLMFVNGQPKTTSSYIQATGRVGRTVGGIVVSFYRASRPRDLSHYEYFAGYHTTLYRHVEPVTVNPFAPRARDRAIGPVAVSILRQASRLPAPLGPTAVGERWRVQQRLTGGNWFCRAGEMDAARADSDVSLIPRLLEARASQQPESRRPPSSDTANHADSELDHWRELAAQEQNRLLYYEPTVTRQASRPVVLGDLAHDVARTGQAYENAPNSLREVEATISIEGRRRS